MNRTSTSHSKGISSLMMNLVFSTAILLFFFFIAVKANAQPCQSFACKSSINVSLGANGTAVITPAMIMATTVGCPGLGTVTLMDGSGQPIGNTATCTYVGQTLQAKLVHQYGNSCWSNVKIEDKLGPQIDCKNTTISCIDAAASSPANQPTVKDNCTAVNNLTFTETVNNFNCGTTTVVGFNGPYEMWKWTTCIPNGGNGTVNQSLMPNQVTVIGASGYPVKTTPRYVTQYKAMATSYGYVKFDWMTSGDGNLNVDAFYFTVNDTCVQLTKTGVNMGSFTSWYVKPGDIIKFEQASDGDAWVNQTKINNFQFIGDIQSQITRTWTATDAYGNTGSCVQVVNVKRITGGVFIFPKSYNDLEKPSLECGQTFDPTVTGYPIWDEDGNLNTLNDQVIVKKSTQGCIKMAYVDQVIASCPGSSTVIREWTIVEYCSSNVFKKTQIIKINDKKGPTITCPPSITVSADLPMCKGNVTLPQATATDDCAGVESITPTWKFGTGYGPHVASVGAWTVTYTAKDKCGNISTCTMTVTVIDNIPPTPVAKSNLVVSLTVGGMAVIPAITFNDGSLDNCCLDKFEVKRMDDNLPFGPTVKFDCDDTGKGVQVIFKVWDCNGNFNTVMVVVNVQDKLTPTFTSCPGNVTVDCGTNLTNLSSYGTPVAVDDCTFTTMYVETPAINGQCGTGTITRTWTATDKSGKSGTCKQVITVKNAAPWNITGSKIVWPTDYTVTACSGTNPLDPNSLPFPSNKPSFKDLSPCTNPLASYTDENFTLNGSTCFKILRKWTVIDWCTYNPNNPNGGGRWEYTQTLNVMDNQVPDLFVPKDTIVFAQGKDCNSILVTFPKATAKDCSPTVTITNNFNTNGDNATGIYPYGTTTVKFFANDGCGNMTVKEMKVTVKDGKKPTPICFHGFSTTITPFGAPGAGGESWIFATMIDAGSYDNCTVKGKLKFSFSSNVNDTMRQYTCDSLGQRFIRLWVTDESGNQDYCETYIDVQNNMGACKNGVTQMVAVAGLVKTEEVKEVENVNMNITYAGSVGIVTDAAGKFLFKSIPTGTKYKITPEKNTNHVNGVSTYDIYLINRHILGVATLASPYKLIAADVDNNGKITVGDVNELRKLVLAIYTTLPNNKSWRFIPKSYIFPTPKDPWSTLFPEVIDLQLTTAQLQNDFVGVKIGDLNASATPNTLAGNAGSRSDFADNFAVENKTFSKGENLRIPFKMSDLSKYVALQFTLGFDTEAFDFIGIEKGNIAGVGNDNFSFADLREGLISASWSKINDAAINENDVLFYLNIKAKKSATLSEVLTLDSRLVNAEAYNESGVITGINLKFGNADNRKFEVYQNQPNPFNATTSIGYQTTEAGEVTLKIYNAAGSEIKILRQQATRGYNQFVVSKDDLNVTGVLIYRIEAGKYHAVRKMIVMP